MRTAAAAAAAAGGFEFLRWAGQYSYLSQFEFWHVGLGVEESVSVENLDKGAIESELQKLIQKGEGMPKCDIPTWNL